MKTTIVVLPRKRPVCLGIFVHSCLLAAVLLLPSCGSAGDNTAKERRMEELEYKRRMNSLQGGPCLPSMGGMTPLWGVGIGSHTNGFQPFSNPGALYSIPQSR